MGVLGSLHVVPAGRPDADLLAVGCFEGEAPMVGAMEEEIRRAAGRLASRPGWKGKGGEGGAEGGSGRERRGGPGDLPARPRPPRELHLPRSLPLAPEGRRGGPPGGPAPADRRPAPPRRALRPGRR